MPLNSIQALAHGPGPHDLGVEDPSPNSSILPAQDTGKKTPWTYSLPWHDTDFSLCIWRIRDYPRLAGMARTAQGSTNCTQVGQQHTLSTSLNTQVSYMRDSWSQVRQPGSRPSSRERGPMSVMLAVSTQSSAPAPPIRAGYSPL